MPKEDFASIVAQTQITRDLVQSAINYVLKAIQEKICGKTIVFELKFITSQELHDGWVQETENLYNVYAKIVIGKCRNLSKATNDI